MCIKKQGIVKLEVINTITKVINKITIINPLI